MRTRILVVVEDDAETRNLVRFLIETEAGLEVVGEAASADEAMRLANGTKPDLAILDHYIEGDVMASTYPNTPNAVLLDLSMNGMSGREVLTSIRSDAGRSTVPVLVVSGHNDPESRIWTLNNGADDFIAKPFDARELAARVGRAVRRTRR